MIDVARNCSKLRMKEIFINGEDLTFEDVVAVAYGQPGMPRVALAPDARKKVDKCADAVETLLERGEIAYGFGTAPVRSVYKKGKLVFDRCSS